MRWKLLVVSSLIASVVGSGATLAIILVLAGSSKPVGSQDIVALSTLIIPIAMILAATIFVYRHTARRRKTQAMATALLSTLLTLAILFTSTYFLSKSTRDQAPTQPGRVT